MTTLQKGMVIVGGIALATTLLMKDRQTVPVLNAAFNGVTKLLGTSMGILRPSAA